MATTTPNLGLTLPAGTEKVSRTTMNANNTVIDSAVGDLSSMNTSNKNSLAEAISEVNGKFAQIIKTETKTLTFTSTYGQARLGILRASTVLLVAYTDNYILSPFFTSSWDDWAVVCPDAIKGTTRDVTYFYLDWALLHETDT